MPFREEANQISSHQLIVPEFIFGGCALSPPIAIGVEKMGYLILAFITVIGLAPMCNKPIKKSSLTYSRYRKLRFDQSKNH